MILRELIKKINKAYSIKRGSEYFEISFSNRVKGLKYCKRLFLFLKDKKIVVNFYTGSDFFEVEIVGYDTVYIDVYEYFFRSLNTKGGTLLTADIENYIIKELEKFVEMGKRDLDLRNKKEKFLDMKI